MKRLAALFALIAASCGGATKTASSSHRVARHYQAVAVLQEHNGVSPHAPVAMTATPRHLFTVCRGNSLLRSVCPSRVPSFVGSYRTLGFCYDRHGRDLLTGGHFERLASSRCIEGAGWGFEAETGLPGVANGTAPRLTGWNGRQWIPVTSESGLFPPPLHVHVEIAAIRISPDTFGWPSATGPPRHIGDELLSPTKAESLGWVIWHGQRGQLVLAPVYPLGGEWGGHLIFYFKKGRVRYAITVHGWMAALRVAGKGGDRVIRTQPGPALPHMIATLRNIVASALRS